MWKPTLPLAVLALLFTACGETETPTAGETPGAATPAALFQQFKKALDANDADGLSRCIDASTEDGADFLAGVQASAQTMADGRAVDAAIAQKFAGKIPADFVTSLLRLQDMWDEDQYQDPPLYVNEPPVREAKPADLDKGGPLMATIGKSAYDLHRKDGRWLLLRSEISYNAAHARHISKWLGEVRKLVASAPDPNNLKAEIERRAKLLREELRKLH